MENEQQPQTKGTPQQTTSPFTEELTKLGRNFSQLIKDALESPQLQEVRKDVATGAQNVIEEINEAMVKAREADVTKTVTQKAAQTAEELKTAPVAKNLKTGLLKALRSVNEELGDIVQKMEQNVQPAPPTDESASAEDVKQPADAGDAN